MVADLAVFAVQRWVAVPLRIPSASMEPALRRGDRILVRHSHDGARRLARDVDRGDVLVLHAPEPGRPLVVKRVIGLPGETIEAVDGQIAIDNRTLLVERWLPEAEREIGGAAARSVDIERTRIGEDQVFVLGDNRDASVDSRNFGPVGLDDVVGTVAVRFWPPGRFGTVDFV